MMNSDQLIGYGTNANVDNLSKIYGTFRIDRDGERWNPYLWGRKSNDERREKDRPKRFEQAG